MNKRLIYIVLFLTLIVKLIVGSVLPIAADEAYYWVWGQNLQLSYFDHPGMVGWLSSLTNFIPILKPALALRIIFISLSTLTFYIWIKVFFTIRTPQNSSVAKYEFIIFAALYNLNPLTGFGSILATPDAPLMFFWALSTLAMSHILISHKTKDYILLGVFLGLGFCSKYHIVFFPLFSLISILLEKKLKHISIKKLFLTFVFGLIFSLPVLIWNYQNDFASFKFQLNHGLNASVDYQSWWSLTYLGGQILIFNPFLIYNVYLGLKNNWQNSTSLKTALGQWLFFFYSSFKAKVEANWPLTSHAGALINLDYKNHKMNNFAIGYYVVLWIAFISLLPTDMGKKKIIQLPTSTTIEEITPVISKYQPLYGPTYQISSLIQLVNQTAVYKLNGISRYDFFDTLDKSSPKESTFYVLKYNFTNWPPQYSEYKKDLIESMDNYNMEIFKLSHE
ncbi:MAG: ArnT family glycosyltransferase [Pseudobdellovibrio sp.]